VHTIKLHFVVGRKVMQNNKQQPSSTN